MAAVVDQLILLLPGLAGPVTGQALTGYIQTRPAGLDRLLSRCTVEAAPASGLASTLCHRFGVSASKELPIAPLCYLADTERTPPHYLLRADPVHLRADQSRLRLFESHSFFITRDEADALVAAINDFSAGRGWRLSAPHPQRWYLELPAAPDMQTTPLAEAAGQDIDALLPRGQDAPHWAGMLSELQMLLHEHPVNRTREQRGEPVINSLWLWGGGVLPATISPTVDAVFAGDVLARGLARHAGTACHPVPEFMGDLLSAGTGRRRLLVLDELAWPAHYGDVDGWLVQLAQLESVWFMPLLVALNSGRIGSLVIDACNGHCFSTDGKRQRGFWKRIRPFEAQFTA